ncbi:N-6 DNA methylase [Nonomuraea sp. NPDC049625]|uniref:N-6 DNA methylase n=1 Tax=Nonomuraea sp. NPDC049625 TaxID=3155775 RepID=UPI00342487B6
MERASKELSLGRALDALRGALTPEDALFLAMALILLSHEANTERTDERGGRTAARQAWDALMAQDFRWRDGHELASVIRSGLRTWESANGGLRELPGLVDARGSQLAPLVDCVAAAPDLAGLFDLCLAHSLTMGRGGQYYTPVDIARLLVGLMAPRKGETVYDPVCGSGGFLLRASEFVKANDGGDAQLALHGQDVNRIALQTAAMNFVIHDVAADLRGPASSLTDDHFEDWTFDVVVANPPFNQTGWDEGGHSRYGRRWIYGVPPAGNANFAWAQHVISKMSPTGRGVLLLPTGAASGTKPAERDIRAGLVEDDVLSCVIELPAGLIPHVRNPVSLWLFSRSKKPRDNWGSNDRSGQYLLIDAREMALAVGRGRRTVPDEARQRIVGTFAAWRGAQGMTSYEDVPGWCRSVSTEEISAQKYDVLPSHYVGGAAVEATQADGEELVARLTDELYELFDKAHRLEGELRDLLGKS